MYDIEWVFILGLGVHKTMEIIYINDCIKGCIISIRFDQIGFALMHILYEIIDYLHNVIDTNRLVSTNQYLLGVCEDFSIVKYYVKNVWINNINYLQPSLSSYNSNQNVAVDVNSDNNIFYDKTYKEWNKSKTTD